MTLLSSEDWLAPAVPLTLRLCQTRIMAVGINIQTLEILLLDCDEARSSGEGVLVVRKVRTKV